MQVKEVIENPNLIPTNFIYKQNPIVILNSDGVVLWSGNQDNFKKDITIQSGYYNDCRLEIRKHDLAFKNNEKVNESNILSPCPFCGNEVDINYLTPIVEIECTNEDCLCYISFKTSSLLSTAQQDTLDRATLKYSDEVKSFIKEKVKIFWNDRPIN